MNIRAAIPVMFMLLAIGCGRPGPEEKNKVSISRVDAQGRVILNAEEVEALGIKTKSVQTGKLSISQVRFGKVFARPEDDERIIALIQGRLLKVSVSLGQKIAPGEPIAIMAPTADAATQANLKTRLSEIHAKISSEKSQILADEIELKRISRLVKSGLATPSQQVRAKATLAAEQARAKGLARSESTLRSFAGGRMEMVAPAPGIIAEINTRVGTLLRQGDTLARIVRKGPRWVDLYVPPDETLGQKYGILIKGSEIPASFVAQGLVVHGGTRTDRLEVASENAASLLPGRMVAVKVYHESSGIIIPLQAIVRLRKDRLCFIEIHTGLYEPRCVHSKNNAGNLAVVSNGIRQGERVVIQGAASLLGELGFSGRLDFDNRCRAH